MQYFRLWNYLPRLLFGLIFFFEGYFLIRGYKTVRDIHYIVSVLKKLDTFIYNVFFISISLSIASIGNFLLNVTSFLFKKFFKAIVKLIFKKRNLVIVKFSNIELAIYLWKKNQDQIKNFVSTQTLSIPQLFTNFKERELVFNEVISHIKNIEEAMLSVSDYELAYTLNHYETVSSEQVISDDLKINIELIFQTCILFLFGVFTYYMILSKITSLILGIPLLIIWTIVVYPYYRSAKMKYAYYLIRVYLDVFKISEWNIADDKEPD